MVLGDRRGPRHAVDRAARGNEHYLPHAALAAELHQAQAAEDVRFDVVDGMIVRVLRQRRGDKVEDELDALERRNERLRIEKVARKDLEAPGARKKRQTIDVRPVEDAHRAALL